MDNQITPYEYVTIVGCGSIGRLVAARWQTRGAEVTGLVASHESLNKLQLHGVNAFQVNLDETGPSLPGIVADSLLYYFVPPAARGAEDSRCRHFLSSLGRSGLPRRIVTISTTGVYGDCHGALVNEEQAPNPQADRARRRLDMENQLRAWCEQHGVDLIILRVGGIYGPERLPVERIRKAVPVLHEELAPKTNRIHEQDLADICVAAASVNENFRIYNVSDGTDSNMTEYFYTLADHFNLPRPPAVGWEEAEQTMSAGMLSYLKESRRVDNSRMLNELGIKLRYPTLEEGLSVIEKG